MWGSYSWGLYFPVEGLNILNSRIPLELLSLIFIFYLLYYLLLYFKFYVIENNYEKWNLEIEILTMMI